MTRVIHTGDTHLGYQQYNLQTRREDFLEGFQQVADDAVANAVDAVIHAGDLFHDRQPALRDILGAMSVLRTLEAADIPFLAIVGNHESKRDRQWLDLFESMGLATRLGDEPVLLDDIAFYGLDFVPRSQRESLDYDFESHEAEQAVLVSHGLFEPFEHGDWDAREILSNSNVTFDALLLGDDHKPQKKLIDEPYEAWLTYCGSTERASASEREDRGYNIVSFEDRIDIRRRGLDTREFIFIDMELGESEGAQRVRERIGQHDIEDAVVIVSLEGAGDEVMPADIEEYAANQGALVTRITDRREFTDEEELAVTFADPDQAVRDRIQDLGLSLAARELDETIRASKIADSNVTHRVETRVAELLEDSDQSVFEGAPEEEDGLEPGRTDSTEGGEIEGFANTSDSEGTDTPDSESTQPTDMESSEAIDSEQSEATDSEQSETTDSEQSKTTGSEQSEATGSEQSEATGSKPSESPNDGLEGDTSGEDSEDQAETNDPGGRSGDAGSANADGSQVTMGDFE